MLFKSATKLLMLVIAALAAGCSGGPDMTNPKDTVSGFVAALEANKPEKAERFILMSDREDFRAEFSNVAGEFSGLPSFPTKPEWKVSVSGDSATVTVENWDDRDLSLTREDGKWFITR